MPRLAVVVVLVPLVAHAASVRADDPLIEWDKVLLRQISGGPESYPLALAQMYASGQRAEAIARLEGWSEADMKAELVTLRSLMRKMNGRLPEDRLRAAVMLHTDRESYERLQSPVVESVRECGINKHGGYARSLIALLIVQSDASREFARQWITAMALSSQWDLCLDDVRRWTHEGLKWFPKDAQLLLIQGTAGETAAALTPEPALYANPNNRSDGLNEIARRRQALSQARGDLDAALALDPDLHEARLRLGRVLWRLEKANEAHAVLQALVEREAEPWILYLGHLFLGRVLEDGGQLPAATEQYRSALAVDPASQAAAMALSEALVTAGDGDEARDVLARAVAFAPRGQPRDAYMSYHLGRANLAEGMLDALRAGTMR